MSSFLDKAKEKAQQLSAAAKEKAEDIKDKRKADDLLDDLGRVAYARHTGRGGDDDETKIGEIVAQLQELETNGTPILGAKPSAPEAPPA